jgi:hypothetical protein
VLASHVLLAVGGLIVWAVYLFLDDDRLTWVALAALGLAATLGLFMASRWLGVYRDVRAVRAYREIVAASEATGRWTAGGLDAARSGHAGAGSGGAADAATRPFQADDPRPSPFGGGSSPPGVSANGRSRAGPSQLGQFQPGLPGRRRAELGPPERNFPLPVVIAHGVFAAVTIMLVLLTALGVGGS